MPPIDGHMMPSGPQGGNTIPLATLIDYSIQRTYHELNVLSELLPRKTDMERKIEIVQFASRSRQLFIRLLALVKWASSATKVDKCGEICQFLEQQSMWFVDTADMLAKMARETLVNARLPNFSLPCAIDVLTLGTYPRLPTCIREKIVPIDPITPAEKADTLHKLTQVIQYRLVSTDLPQQMRKLRVENGRVKFLVEHEFEVTLTLMGDSAAIPWRLLDINILVEDPETGDGKSLVHSLQVNFIHQLAQSRLLENDKPLHDLYRVLHSFCQSLQLEVLHSQTQRLIRERMGDSIRVEDYTVGRCLVVSYWRDQLKKEKVQEPVVYKLKVHVCEEDGGKPLQINHSPVMAPEESTRVGLAIKSNHLSIERLLMQTIEVRTHAKLKDLSKDLQKYVDGKCDLRDLPIALQVPILNPSMDSEQLRIMVDSQRGTLRAHIPVSSDLQVRQDIEECLNIEQKGLNKHIVNLRLHLCLLRCEKSAQYLPTSCQRHLPLVNLTNHPLEKLTKHQLFIRIPKQSCHYLVVELDEKKNKDVDYRYYILETTPCTADGTEDFIAEDIGAKLYLKAGRLIPLDSFSFTHGPYTRVFDEEEETELQTLRRKRKILLGQMDEPKAKKTKGSAYFIPELAYILASCEERIPFVALGSEFERNGIVHSGVQVDSQGTCFCLSVVSMPDVDDCSKKTNEGIKKLVLSIKVRVLSKPSRNWIIEYSFARSLLQSANKKEQGPLQRVTYMYELNIDNIQKMVKEMLDEWSAICHLYSIIEEFSEIYNDSRTGLQATVNIHSYNFRRLTLVYGPNKTSIANIQWKSDIKQFYINFGTIGQCTTINPHVVMATQLIQELNCTRSLTQVAQILHDTWSPMTSINKLSTGITLASTSNPKQQTPCFSIVPQSTTHIRIAFRSVSCVDVHFKSNKIVAIRDGAYSLFDNSKAVDGFNPTPMLKAFLNTFVDDAVSGRHMRRISTTEDDNPPSPVGIDSMDVFNMSQPPSMGSPASRRQDGGLRFPSPMTPPSNPHTPASPSAARMSSATVTPSPSAALIGTPSPGNVLGVGSPGNPPLHVPSPGSFVPAPSPQSMGIQMQSPASSFISPQGMVEGGSPYPNTGLAMPSPGQRYWSNSPSVPGPSPASRQGTAMSPGHPALHSPQTQSKDGGDHKTSVMPHPSRILPQRSWAASFPTLISHEAFDNLLTPNKLQPMPFSVLTSPLERFLGCVFLRRHLPRIIQNLDQLRQLPTTEAHVVTFKVESLQFRVNFNMTTLQTLHMNVTPVPEYRDQWPAEVTQILEKFFDYKVACPPYKVNALTAFCRLLSIPFKILKDCIQIMRLELIPDTNMKWSVQWCLTIPPTGAFVAAAGTTAVAVTAKNKMVLMLQLTRIGLQLPQGVEPQSVIVQLIYDFNNNTIQPMEPKTPSPQQNTPAQNMISQMLKRFSDYHQNSSECAIYPAVRDLMTNFVAPPV